MSPLIFQNIHLWEFTKSEIVYIIYGTIYRDVLFEFHLKFWNTISIGILFEVYFRVDSLLTGLKAHKREQLLNGNQIKSVKEFDLFCLMFKKYIWKWTFMNLNLVQKLGHHWNNLQHA